MARRALLALALLLAACGGPPASTPSPATSAGPVSAAAAPEADAGGAPSTASAAQSASTSAPSPAPSVPTGGSVLVGDIPGTKKFEPKAVIDGSKAAMLDCYNQARAKRPDLSGKVKLDVVVNQAGAVVSVEAQPGGSANDPALVACVRSAWQTLVFPKPSGMATVVVPLLFRP